MPVINVSIDQASLDLVSSFCNSHRISRALFIREAFLHTLSHHFPDHFVGHIPAGFVYPPAPTNPNPPVIPTPAPQPLYDAHDADDPLSTLLGDDYTPPTTP